MDTAKLGKCLENVRATVPLVHCITNYVTVNDCANALLGCGGSPIMSDEPADVEDITSICGGLVLNIGTLNTRSVEGMRLAGARAAKLGHPIVLDPVGAGASKLRTATATELLDTLPIAVLRGNMSEIKAVAGAAAATRGVDANPEDAVTETNLAESASFARQLAQRLDCVIAITGAIDIVASAVSAVACQNGVPFMGKMTGTGCMLTCLIAAYVTANQNDPFAATAAAVALEGLAGQLAYARMEKADGNGSFRTYLLDALCTMTSKELVAGALLGEV